MPQLGAIKEYTRYNHYDAWFLGDGGEFRPPVFEVTRLFGPLNVGNRLLANHVAPHVLWPENMGIIDNWYARSTNLTPAIVELSNLVTCELIIGDRIYRRMTMFDLLRGRPSPDGRLDPEEDYKQRDQDDHERAIQISERTRVGVDHVLAVLKELRVDPRYLYVPKNQNFKIDVKVARDGELLNREIQRQSQIEGGTPGIWVHIEGWVVRDIV